MVVIFVWAVHADSDKQPGVRSQILLLTTVQLVHILPGAD